MPSILNEPVLCLNRSWHPVTFLPVQVAVVTVMRDMASVLDPVNFLLLTFEEWAASKPQTERWIKTAHDAVPAPDVIVLKKYGERPPRKIAFNRPNLGRRDEWTCQYCGDTLGGDLTVEHVLPRSRGGATSWENCVAACADCNARKADRTPDEAGMRLRARPIAPRWTARLELPRGTARPIWAPFLAKDS
jgi:5-methylcytosine-specific restriction endonuclease McrA